MRRIVSLLAIFLIISLSLSSVSLSQDAEPKKIKLIRVKENKSVSTAVILSKIKSKKNEIFSQDLLNDDLKRLYSLGYFTDISVDVSDYEDGVSISFIVEEKPVIKRISFSGAKKIRIAELTKEISTKVGIMLDESKLAQDITVLKKFYEKKGFHRVKIDYSTIFDKKMNTVNVTIVIIEAAPTKIRYIFWEGNEHYPDKLLLKVITTRADSLLTSGYFKEAIFEEDLEKVKAYYGREGYLDVAVDSEVFYYDDDRHMDITIIVDEGKKYLVGNIALSGNALFSEDEVRNVLELTRNKAFSQERMGMDGAHIQEIYYNKGYIMCRVLPTPLVNNETGRIDISYAINEGDLIYVNRVNIVGNTKTKDTVIRRELRAYPGEPFDGSQIKRSKERLNNLGYFEDISFDTIPTNDPVKRDLVVNVKETKTGEFSFGGGYSSIDRLIGFASVNQRNFDITNFPTFTGGGQNLSLRGEFGLVRSNYMLSWTDPWIFGFPYSFGFDLYRTTHDRERAVGYGWEEERWGGNARLVKEFTDFLRADLI